jgi:hypothetical protein
VSQFGRSFLLSINNRLIEPVVANNTARMFHF